LLTVNNTAITVIKTSICRKSIASVIVIDDGLHVHHPIRLRRRVLTAVAVVLVVNIMQQYCRPLASRRGIRRRRRILSRSVIFFHSQGL
jgi:hypothetical protein